MRKIVLTAGCAGVLAAVALASPVRGQVPPPPPPPNGGTPLPTIGLPCPPTGCPTATPAPTNTPTSTPIPTAVPTNTPVPLFVRAKVAHSSVKAGQKQKVTVTTLPGASVKVVLAFPNKSKKTHNATAGAAGKSGWTFTQPGGKATRKSKVVKVTVTASNGTDRRTTHKTYKIG